MKRLVYTRLIESLDRLLDLYFLIQAGDLPPSLLRIFFVRLLHLPRLGLLLRNLSSLLENLRLRWEGVSVEGLPTCLLHVSCQFCKNYLESWNIFSWKYLFVEMPGNACRILWIPEIILDSHKFVTMLAKFRQIFDGITWDVNEILIKSGR